MGNTKLFKDDISDKLYKNIIDFVTEIHDQERRSNKINKKMKIVSKLTKASAFTSVGLTLGTIATIAINYYINNPDSYRVAVDAILYGGVASLAAITLSIDLNNKLGKLESKYLDTSYRNHMDDVLKYYSFENELVNDLKNIGIDVKSKKMMSIEHFMTLRNMDVKKTDVDFELKAKTTEFVKSLMDEYTNPEVVKKIKKNIP